MDKRKVNNETIYRQEHMLYVFLRVIVSMILLIGGIIMLALRIPGWGIILGLPMVVFGVVFLIYTYDEALSRSVEEFPDHPSKDE
jgi:uncharacterized membrane protein